MPKTYRRYRGNTFLTAYALVELHDRVLAESDGLPGIRDRGALESAALRPMVTVGGEDAYPTLFSKTAAMGYTIAQNHPFSDANKRTAYTAMLWTLKVNGYKLRPSPDAGTTVMVLVATGNLTIEGLRVALIHWCGLNPGEASL